MHIHALSTAAENELERAGRKTSRAKQALTRLHAVVEIGRVGTSYS
jgi:hypothetical protein